MFFDIISLYILLVDKKKIHFKNGSLIFNVTLVLVNVSISRYFSDVMEEKHFFSASKSTKMWMTQKSLVR